MKIPIRNVFYLLTYAWDRLEESETIDVNFDDAKTLPELFGRVLATGTAFLITRGLDKGYRTHEQAISGVKGKILLGATVRGNYLAQARTFCEVDDFTSDVLHNQIIKTTIGNLLRIESLAREVRSPLLTLHRRMEGIREITLTGHAFRSVQLHRNIGLYDFLLQVCRFVHDNLLLNEDGGHARFRDFTRDRVALADLFQRFILRFLAREQQSYTVRSPQVAWAGVESSEVDKKFLPIMQTDVVLYSPDRVLIIDAKFYRKAFQERFGKRKVRSAHLYQMYSYMRNLQPTIAATRVDGLLLYPATTHDFDIKYKLGEHSLRLKSINLAREWHRIHEDLLSAIDASAFAR